MAGIPRPKDLAKVFEGLKRCDGSREAGPRDGGEGDTCAQGESLPFQRVIHLAGLRQALASLPAGARAAKLDSARRPQRSALNRAMRCHAGATLCCLQVKAGILKRLQAGSVSRSPAAPAPAPPPPPPAPPPPSEPSPEREGSSATAGVEGVELFGDVPWFADSELRARLLEDVRQAHAAEKILVASPMEEIPRILPKSGQVLGAGAVLRLGGVHHGGYGESDINYAYRQLSRALHPDKNPGVEEAAIAFCICAHCVRASARRGSRCLQAPGGGFRGPFGNEESCGWRPWLSRAFEQREPVLL